MNSNELFPIYGVTLGQTTIADIESKADDIHKTGQGGSVLINDVFFTEVVEEKCIRYAGICNYCCPIKVQAKIDCI